jgi:uncharacterized protein YcfJ
MNSLLRTALALATVALASQAVAQVTFYENDGFDGRSFSIGRPVSDFSRTGFNDRASSVIVLRDRWEVCTDAGYRGRCVVLRPGRYASLSAMGLNDRVSSVRAIGSQARIDDDRYAPPPVPVYDNQRRRNERLYQADVTSVRAVVGPPQQRCWIEHEPVVQQRSGNNVPGALIGAVLGGILGHQVGGGRGQDIATAGGAVAGAVVGSKVGQDGESQAGTREVQRCASTPASGKPIYWDVGYRFRGLDHQIQMTSQPGRSITVNGRGEPRA